MVTTLRTTFDKRLDTLQSQVLSLAEMVESELLEAVKALHNQDPERAERVNTYDKNINQYRYNIEQECYALLALQQPFARDLRRIVSAVNIVNNLERMGDHAAGIARLVIQMADIPNTIFMPALHDITNMVVESLRASMQALANQDTDLALHVMQRDAKIDELTKQTNTRLIQMMSNNPANIECATRLLWVSHNLERFGDHVHDICERIIYYVTGQLGDEYAKG